MQCISRNLCGAFEGGVVIGAAQPQHDRACRHLLEALDALVAGRRSERLRGVGAVLSRTRKERRTALRRAFRDLYAAGFHLAQLTNFSAVHITALLRAWRERGLAVGTIRVYAGYLKSLCRWLGKPQLVSHLDRLIEAERNTAVKSTALLTASQSQASVRDLFVVAGRLDRRFACVLLLMAAFRFTPKQAWLSCPRLATEVPHQQCVRWRMRDGASEVVPVDAETRAVMVWATTFAMTATSSMIPPADSLSQWRRQFYRHCRKIGLTRRLSGLTPQLLYHRVQVDTGTRIRELLELARGTTEEALRSVLVHAAGM